MDDVEAIGESSREVGQVQEEMSENQQQSVQGSRVFDSLGRRQALCNGMLEISRRRTGRRTAHLSSSRRAIGRTPEAS